MNDDFMLFFLDKRLSFYQIEEFSSQKKQKIGKHIANRKTLPYFKISPEPILKRKLSQMILQVMCRKGN